MTYFSSAQEKKGDGYLDEARNLRDQWGQVIPSSDLTAVQNRITMATEMRHGLDGKIGFSKITHARACRKYSKETLRVVKTTSDRVRDAEFISLVHEPHDEKERRVVRKAEAICRAFLSYKDALVGPNFRAEVGMGKSRLASGMQRLAQTSPHRVALLRRYEEESHAAERFYGFDTSKACLNNNIANVQNLKTNSAFINDDKGDNLPYRHPIIQKTVNVIWFNDRSSDGIVFQSSVNPMPYEAIALVLAVIGCCIDEWSKGPWADIPFTYEDYKEVYSLLLEALKGLTTQALSAQIAALRPVAQVPSRYL
ncbi:hypothetical protein EDB89DRAFT_2203553 [Lactarius sanguifluus]|nr:hypothetical protein EDB89DRAFT_2203553 [Lactarius sanguifluus]